MDAVISGRARKALVLDDGVLMSFDLNGAREFVPRQREDLRVLLGESNDAIIIENASRDEIIHRLEFEKSFSTALDLSLISLDPELSDEVRIEAVEALDELLTEENIVCRVENILFAQALPAAADLLGAQTFSIAQGKKVPQAFFERLAQNQPTIRNVRQAWESIPLSLFGSARLKTEFHDVVLREGLFRKLSISSASRASTEGLLLQALQHESVCAMLNHREVLHSWGERICEITDARVSALKGTRQSAEEDLPENCYQRLSWSADEYAMDRRSPQTVQIYKTILAIAPLDVSVLITGERETEKELIARVIHDESHRAGRFELVDCAAIPRDDIESALFGYKKGALSGAEGDRCGLIQVAAGGTLVLDGIDNIPPHVLSKVFRALREKSFFRLGDEREIEADFRLVMTSRNKDIPTKDWVLREDPYSWVSRLSEVRVGVPPLRELGGGLAPLIARFLQRYTAEHGKHITGLSQDAVLMLVKYDWPGNVRELENMIEHAVLLCDDDQIGPEHFPDLSRGKTAIWVYEIPASLDLEEIEREMIKQTLNRTGGDKKKTAEILKLHHPTLSRKLRKLGFKREDRDTI